MIEYDYLQKDLHAPFFDKEKQSLFLAGQFLYSFLCQNRNIETHTKTLNLSEAIPVVFETSQNWTKVENDR